MADGGEGSVTIWIGALKTGGGIAAQELWTRYFETLVRVARGSLRNSSRAARDEEDIALSAFDSFFAAAARGRFPQLENRDDLWRILVTITRRKAIDEAQHQRRLKRAGATDRGPSSVADAWNPIDYAASPEPTPEFVALVADQCRRLLESLADDQLRQLALLKMEGYTNDEIAERLCCGLRSVVRKLDLIRRTWLAECSE